jgi:hypothetical protein
MKAIASSYAYTDIDRLTEIQSLASPREHSPFASSSPPSSSGAIFSQLGSSSWPSERQRGIGLGVL